MCEALEKLKRKEGKSGETVNGKKRRRYKIERKVILTMLLAE